LLGEAFAFFFAWDFGDGCDGAVDRVVFNLFDLWDCFGFGFEAGFFGQVDGGDADGAEEKTGAIVVDLVLADAAGEFGEGELDGEAVFEAGKIEG
jgi:hypothetical protein